MPQILNGGLYRVRRASTASKSVQHAAVADVGNRLGLLPRRDVFNSRAVVIVCHDEDAARKRFGVVGEGIGICYTRTGRRFFLLLRMTKGAPARQAPRQQLQEANSENFIPDSFFRICCCDFA